MQIKALLAALAGAAMVADAADLRRSPFHAAIERRQNRNGGQGGNDGQGQNRGGGNGNNQGGGNGNNQGGGNGNNNRGGGGGNGGLQLSQNVLQRGSANDGNNPGSAEQAASATYVTTCSPCSQTRLT